MLEKNVGKTRRTIRRSHLLVGLVAGTVAVFGFADSTLAWEPTSAAPDQLRSLHAALSRSIYPLPHHGAKPLGLTGFEFYLEAAADVDFESKAGAGAVSGSLPLDTLAPIRLGVRKGLPGGFDLGVAYSRFAGWDFGLWSGEVQYRLVEGGAVVPWVGVRVVYSRGSAAEYELDQYGAELIVSKALTVVSLFAGAGLMNGDGTFFFTSGPITRLSAGGTSTSLFGGVRLNLLVPKLTFAVEKTENWQAVFRISLGL